MKSGLKIRWTDEATKNLESIILFLESNWTSKELKRFFRMLEKQLHLLTKFPEAYSVTIQKKGIRKCVFTKNVTIYYTVREEQLVLLSLFDTRQLPSKVKL
jgi:plasmid stabilization system protein ParE